MSAWRVVLVVMALTWIVAPDHAVAQIDQLDADLSIAKTNGVTIATPGGSVIYSIIVSNLGHDTAAGVTVMDVFSEELACTWFCTGAGGGTCTPNGSGHIFDSTVALPVAASATYTAICTIAPWATGTLSNTAIVVPPPGVFDPDPENNSATDIDTLGLSGPSGPPPPIPTLSPLGMLVLALVLAVLGVMVMRGRRPV